MRFSKNSILRKKPLTLLVAMVTRTRGSLVKQFRPRTLRPAAQNVSRASC